MMHKTRTLLLTCLAMAVVFALASCAPVYIGKVYTTSGKYNIASGGELEVLSGGVVDFQSGSYVTMSSGLLLDGGSDEVQLTVQGYTTQTNPIMVIENQVGADIMTVASNTITMSGSIVGQGALDISGGDITLQNDETISNGTNNYVTVTLGAGTGNLGVATGNIKVGNGTESVTLNGEDAYIEGTLEADGAVRFDSTLEVNGDITLENDETISNGYNGVITATATTFHVQGNETASGSMTAGTGVVVTTGGLDIQGGDLTLANDESIGNATNGTIQITATTTSLSGALDVTGGDIVLENDETIDNGVNGTIGLNGDVVVTDTLNATGEIQVASTAFIASASGYVTSTAKMQSAALASTAGTTVGNALVVTTGGVDIQGGDLVLANDESIGNSANGTIAVTATNLSLSNYVLYGSQPAQLMTFNDEPVTPTGTYMHITAAGNLYTDQIVAGTAGQLLILTNDANVSIVLTDTGALMLAGNQTLTQYDIIQLISDGTNWRQAGPICVN